MNCHEIRELLSAWLDEVLDDAERTAVDQHLAGCTDCRRELERLRSTVSLLARVEPARAPAGFVDRVVTRAHSAPWYVRLGRFVFVPLSIKLPVEAGAMVVIALLGVYLLQTTPELKDAARQDTPAPAMRAEPPAAPAPSPPAPAAAPGPAQAPAPERDAQLRKAVPPAAAPDKRERSNVAAPAPAEQTQDMPEKRKEAGQEPTPPTAPAMAERARAAGPLPRTAAPASPGLREDSADKAGGDRKALAAPPAASSVLSAKQQAAPPSVMGALAVKDRPAAERALADLISRTGAQEVGRRQDGAATVVEVVVPQAAYAAFVKDLGALGSLRVDGTPAEALPLVRLSVRISE